MTAPVVGPQVTAWPRTLLTTYPDGQVFIEGRDVVVIHKGNEGRIPLAHAEIQKGPFGGWGIKQAGSWLGKTIRKPDNEQALHWLREIQPRVRFEQEILDISEGRSVLRRFQFFAVAFERGYLRLDGSVRVPAHMVLFAGTESRQAQKGVDKKGRAQYGTDTYLTIYGSGTKVGEARCAQRTADQAADWINSVVQAIRANQEQAARQAQETHIPVVKCLYCGTRSQGFGRCSQCGAPLPEA